MARSRSHSRSRSRSRSHSHRSRSRSHSRSRRTRRSHHPDRKTYHPCTVCGKSDLAHTYHARHPAAAAEKYAKHLYKKGHRSGTVHVKEVTRGSNSEKVHSYRYTGRRLTKREMDDAKFERDGVCISPSVSVTVTRV